MELHEAIAKVHEAMEGRYDLDGYDLHEIHGLLCEMQIVKNSNAPAVVKSVCKNCNSEVEPIPLGYMCPNCACDM